MARRFQSSRHRGFTLIEFLVVISIIGLLIAVLVPSLSRGRHQVRGVACASNLKQLMNGMTFYITEYGVFPGTHSLFYFQSLFGTAWPRPAGVTWDGARDRLVELTINPGYTKPYHLDPEFHCRCSGQGHDLLPAFRHSLGRVLTKAQPLFQPVVTRGGHNSDVGADGGCAGNY